MKAPVWFFKSFLSLQWKKSRCSSRWIRQDQKARGSQGREGCLLPLTCGLLQLIGVGERANCHGCRSPQGSSSCGGTEDKRQLRRFPESRDTFMLILGCSFPSWLRKYHRPTPPPPPGRKPRAIDLQIPLVFDLHAPSFIFSSYTPLIISLFPCTANTLLNDGQ